MDRNTFTVNKKYGRHTIGLMQLSLLYSFPSQDFLLFLVLQQRMVAAQSLLFWRVPASWQTWRRMMKRRRLVLSGRTLVACRDEAIGFPGNGTEVKYISPKSEDYRISVVISVCFVV